MPQVALLCAWIAPEISALELEVETIQARKKVLEQRTRESERLKAVFAVGEVDAVAMECRLIFDSPRRPR